MTHEEFTACRAVARTAVRRVVVQRAVRTRGVPALFLATMFAGCIRGTLPATELYRLRSLTPLAARPDSAVRAPAALAPITVAPYTTVGVYSGSQIVYRVGETRYGAYPTREWAVPLGTMLASLTAQSLRELPGRVGEVDDAAHGATARGLVWRGTVREFEEVDRPDAPAGARVAAAVRLDAELVRQDNDSVVWRGTARAERIVTPATVMTAVVDSLAAAAGSAIADLARAAAPTLQTPVAPARDRPR